MRHECSGGIYGKPFTLQLITETGKSITLVDDGTKSEARQLHREIMSIERGPKRAAFIHDAYVRITEERRK